MSSLPSIESDSELISSMMTEEVQVCRLLTEHVFGRWKMVELPEGAAEKKSQAGDCRRPLAHSKEWDCSRVKVKKFIQFSGMMTGCKGAEGLEKCLIYCLIASGWGLKTGAESTHEVKAISASGWKS